MNKKSTISIIISLCCFSLLYPQDNTQSSIIPLSKGWSVGFGYGLTLFNGDIREYDFFPAQIKEAPDKGTPYFSELQSASSVSLSKKVNSYYSVSAELLSGKFAGLKRHSGYAGYTIYDPHNNYEGAGDKFVASLTEVDLLVNIDISTIISFFAKTRKANNFSFEGKLGVGYNKYNSVRTNLHSDSYINSFGYEDEGTNSKGSDYGTQKMEIFSSPSETAYIYGILTKYKLNNRLSLVLDYTVRNGKTDKWDASIMETQNSDKFTFLSLGIAYKFGDHDYKNEWKSPIDELKDDVSTLFVKIDGLTEDTDNDGVSDAFDKNRTTPLGVAVDGAGIALDVDMDDVPDYRDADPFSNKGVQVDENGVELDDNSKDLKFNTAVAAMVNQFPSIYFNLGSVIVERSNESKMATIALLLKSNPSIKLKVIGHTDNVGNTEFNKILGLKRANSAIKYLVLNYNIEANRLIAVTKGEDDPLSAVTQIANGVPTDESTNRLAEINRRVDFRVAD